MDGQSIEVPTNPDSFPGTGTPLVPPAAEATASDAPVVEGTPIPEGLPDGMQGKFTSVEQLAASYAALEQKLAQGAAPAPTLEMGITPEPTPGEAATQDPELPQGVTPEQLAPFQQEILLNGDLSVESRGQMKALIPGLSDAIIDQQIQGIKATDELFRLQVVSEAGGAEAYIAAMNWASKALGKDDIAAFNKAISDKDIHKVVPHIRGLMARYNQSVRENPAVLSGQSPHHASTVEPFRSRAEEQEAMQDPKYWKSEAYAQEVQDRIRASQGRY